jgi:hypothetical protein
MKNIIERLNMRFGVVKDANADVYVMQDGDAYSAISYLTSGDYSADGYDAAIEALTDFYRSANDDAGYTVSVWLD